MKAFYSTEILFISVLNEKSVYLFAVYFNDVLWHIIE